MKASDPHRRLVEGYRKQCPNGWVEGPDDGYFLQKLPHHLQRAGLDAELTALLLDFAWIDAKLAGTDLAILLEDYRLEGLPACFSAVEDAIRLSSHVIQDNRRELAAQLKGRLDADAPTFEPLFESIDKAVGSASLIPLRAGMIAGGGPLIGSFSGHGEDLAALAVSAYGRLALSASDATALLWDIGTSRTLQRLAGHSDDITCLAFLPDGKRAVSGAKDATLRVWDLGDGRPLLTLQGHTGPVVAVAADAVGRILSASEDGTLRLWNGETGEPLTSAWARTGTASSRENGTAEGQSVDVFSYLVDKIGAMLRPKPEQPPADNPSSPTHLAVNHAKRRVVVASKDGTIVIRDTEDGHVVARINSGGKVQALTISPSGEYLVAAVSTDLDGDRIKAWHLEFGKLELEHGSSGDFFDDLAFSAGGCHLLVANYPKPVHEVQLSSWIPSPTPIQVRRFDPPNEMSLLSELHGHIGGARLLRGALERDIVLSYGKEKLVRVWDLDRVADAGTDLPGEPSRQATVDRPLGTSSIADIGIDPHGRVAVSVAENGKICVWELESGRLARTIHCFERGAARMATPPRLAMVGGRTSVVVAHAGSQLSELNWETGAVVRAFEVGVIPEDYGDQEPLISSLLLTPRNLLVASCFYDELLVWDFRRGERLALIRGGNLQPEAPNQVNDCYPIALFPDGRRLIWGNCDDQLQVVDLEARETLLRTPRHEEISQARVLPDGTTILTSAYRKQLLLWNLDQPGAPVATMAGHAEGVEDVDTSPDGVHAFSCGPDATLRAWHLPTRTNIATLHTDAQLCVCRVSPDGNTVVVGNRAGGVDCIRWRER